MVLYNTLLLYNIIHQQVEILNFMLMAPETGSVPTENDIKQNSI